MDISRFKAVIFDFDGTLYDNTGISKTLVLTALPDAFKMAAERKTHKEFLGRDEGTPQKLREAFYKQAAKRAFTSPQKFGEWYQKCYLSFLQSALKNRRYHARENIEELFATFKAAGIKIAVYSEYERVKERMLSCGIGEKAVSLCDGFFSHDNFGCMKPAARGFLQIASKFGVLPAQCLVVGDRDNTDGQGARNAGMGFIQIKTRKSKPVIDTTHEILEWHEFLQSVLQKQ